MKMRYVKNEAEQAQEQMAQVSWLIMLSYGYTLFTLYHSKTIEIEPLNVDKLMDNQNDLLYRCQHHHHLVNQNVSLFLLRNYVPRNNKWRKSKYIDSVMFVYKPIHMMMIGHLLAHHWTSH